MPTCPLCLFDNAPDAAACEHCGRFRFTAVDMIAEPSPEADTLHGTRWKESLPERFGAPQSPALPSAPLTPVDHFPPVNTDAEIASPPVDAVPVPTTAKLVVVRGQKLNEEFPLLDGANYLGRTAERPADIDLSGLESQDQVWSSRQHAVIHKDKDQLSIEDLNSLNGTFVNRQRLHPGRKFVLKANDVIQIGTVQLRVII